VGRKTNKQRREKQATTAREKAALARAEQQRDAQRRRALTVIGTVAVIAVVAVIGAVVALNHHGKQSLVGNRAAANPNVVKQLGAVTPATLQTVALGSDQLAPKKVGDPALTSGGKPELLFIGAEFCPYCGAERWPLIESLMRFGTFKNLSEISSSSTDVDANTPTFSFYKSSYTSKYLSFVSVEDETRTSKALENPTAAEDKLWVKYTGNPPGFPFLDYGGKFVQTSQSYDPGILSGMTQSQVAAQLNTPTSTIAKAIDGAANMTTATICTMTNNQPASVCLSPVITNLQAQIGA
jgi:hypothetical protein